MSGLNARCWIPEHSTLPSAKDLLRCWPLREHSDDLEGFSLDIKAAHKRIVLHPSEQGLVGFSLDGKLFFYRVTPFGASFSAAWWSRVGGWLLRFFHQLLWWSHVGLLYVDDFIFFMNKMMMPVGATLMCVFCRLCHIPISWGKSELSGSVKWIGWIFHLNSGYIELPQDKLQKLLAYLTELQSSSRTSRKKPWRNSLDSVCGSHNCFRICALGFIIYIVTCMSSQAHCLAWTQLFGLVYHNFCLTN